jgi:hypothetical protein
MNCPHCGQPLAIIKAVSSGPGAPAPKAASATPDHWEPVTKTVTCNRCGATELAWLKSRQGKPYLAQARRLPDGRLGADRREFHECPGNRTAAQANIHGAAIDDSEIPF